MRYNKNLNPKMTKMTPQTLSLNEEKTLLF